MTVTPSVVAVAVLVALAVVCIPSQTTAGEDLGTAVRNVGERHELSSAARRAPAKAARKAAFGIARGRRLADRAPGAVEVSAALSLLALAFRSGLPTWDVLLAVARGSEGPVSRDLRQVAAALQWGADEAEAWGSVGAVWSPAARAVAIAQQAGVPPAPMLVTAAEDLRRAELDRLEVGAAKAGVRLVAPLGLVLLPAFCLTTVVPLVIALAGQFMAT
jgi:pilus assembly protein TadC